MDLAHACISTVYIAVNGLGGGGWWSENKYHFYDKKNSVEKKI